MDLYMKIKYKSVICIILILAVIVVLSPISKAAGLTISFSQSTANVGDNVTVTVTGSGITGSVNLSVSGNATLSQNTVWVENGSASVNATINGTGDIRITATAASMADSTTAAEYTGSTGGTITVANTSSSGSSSSSSSSTESTPRATTTTSQESSNANLSNLGIRPNDFSGFRPGTTTYNVTVPADVESVEVYATAQDSGATISGTGSRTLQNGANALNVTVTAEDGTTKTYTINVTREGEETTDEEDQAEENTETVNGLSNITIGNLELNPGFSPDTYEYTVDYIGEDTSLDIQTVATDPSYTVEVLGNEELKEGENTITILVTDEEGNNVATYQVTVNKSLVDEEALAREEAERQQQEQRRMLMIAGGIILLIIIIVIIIIIKRRRNRMYAEEFSGVPFAGMNNDEEDLYDDYDNYEYNDYDSNNADEDNNVEVSNDNYRDFQIDEHDVQKIEENDKNSDKKQSESMHADYINQDQESNIFNTAVTKKQIDDSKELAEKERAKKEFLKGYDSQNDSEYYEEERPRRGRKKGKRFK